MSDEKTASGGGLGFLGSWARAEKLDLVTWSVTLSPTSLGLIALALVSGMGPDVFAVSLLVVGVMVFLGSRR